MKGRILLLICIVGVMLTFAGCKEKKLELDFSTVESVEIVDGKNGEKAVFNKNASNDMLKAVQNIISSRKFQRDKENQSNEYKYMFVFKDSSRSDLYTIYIVSENTIIYDGFYYKTDRPIDLIYIDSLYCS